MWRRGSDPVYRPSAAVGTVSTAVLRVSASVGTWWRSVDNLRTTVGTLRTTVGTPPTSVGTRSTKVGTVWTTVGTASTGVGTVPTNVDGVLTNVGTVPADVGTASAQGPIPAGSRRSKWVRCGPKDSSLTSRVSAVQAGIRVYSTDSRSEIMRRTKSGGVGLLRAGGDREFSLFSRMVPEPIHRGI